VDRGDITNKKEFYIALGKEIIWCIEGGEHNVCHCPPSFSEPKAKAVCYNECWVFIIRVGVNALCTTPYTTSLSYPVGCWL
jgi:hypothetical protein